MDQRTLLCCVVLLLLLLCLCLDAEVYEYKTIGRGPDVTPICTNTTEQVITLLVCKIRTYRTGGECRLLYRYGGDFEHECDSRFTLKMEKQTVFLHLTGLTPVDSGNHTCWCSLISQTVTLHLNITVEEEGERESGVTSHTWVLNVFIAATTVISITAVIFGLIYRVTRHRRQTQPLRSPQNMEPEAIEPYSTFMWRDSVLYSTVGPHNCPNNRNQSNTSTTEDTRPEALL
ncbi:uncharacterized protein LOC134127003 isoform X2 [Pungitius pungitius]|uniref:uncharacterized protein LOC134127003 isoform X2 n=1 Tax=Pungitius pungitius TaxID=134920 RepID=UPI002E0F1791